MIVYVASKSRHWPWWQALRAAGLDIQASWVDWPPNQDCSEPSADEWRDHWKGCIVEATKADVILVFAQADERQNGALIELGVGLASGAMVYVVSDSAWSVSHHPRARNFRTLADAVTAIVAADAGERARRRAA
jgi:hypothetical protein